MSERDPESSDGPRQPDELEPEVLDLSDEPDPDVLELVAELQGAGAALPDAEPDEVTLDLVDEPVRSVRQALSDDLQRSRAIEEVLRDAARRDVLRASAYRRPRSSLRMHVAAAVLALVALGAWLLPLPLLQPEIELAAPPERQEAGLRFAMYVQSQQIKAFWQARGRLPDVLLEAGEPLPGMRYERLDARTYRLSGRTGTTALDWVSSDSLRTLLGDAHLQVDMGFAR